MRRVAQAAARLPRSLWWSVLVYVAVAAWQGRDVVRTAATRIANDTGDPLLNATVLSWGAQRVPFTQAWWDLPIYTPTRDALAFAEHLLGLAPLSTPLYWATGSGLAAYNITTLLTFPLSAAAMAALVYSLTRSGAASFLAGIAYGFAPYRIAHLSHLQGLASFWAPLALLGLHRYLATAKVAWLALFGATWALQGLANGYYLVFFSVLVGLWTIWFAILRGRWVAASALAAAALVAALPIVPVVLRYRSVHDHYGFSRSLAETVFFSADVAGVLCASERLDLWAWLRIGCKLEGELFPGATIPIACLGALLVLWRRSVSLPGDRRLRLLVQAGCVVALAYLAIALSVWWWGRWRIELGPVTATASSFLKPFSTAMWAALVAFVVTARFGRIGGSAAAWFYAGAALVTWMLSLGPIPMMFEKPAFELSPYSWLMAIPGIESLRVPARFFMMTVLCLSVLLGLLASEVFRVVKRPAMIAITAAVAAGLFADGWIDRIPTDVPPDMLWADRLKGAVVVELPFQHVDTAPGFRAVEGGWRTVNGYSGYSPPAFPVLRAAARAEDGSFLPYLASAGVVYATVRKDSPRQVEMVERHAGVRPLDESGDRLLFSVPQRSSAVALGSRVAVAAATASCEQGLAAQMIDGRERTLWDCGVQFADAEVVLDLGRAMPVGAVRHVVGPRPIDHPRHLVVETSADGTAWRAAWSGGTAGLAFQASVVRPQFPSFVLPFDTRPARYVRLRQTGRDPETHWSVAELEVYDSATPR